jgi:lactoylglutathione lyase
MQARLAHTMIRVRDLDASIAFYSGFLGLKEVRRSHFGDECTLVFLADDAESYHIELTCNHDGRDYELGTQFGHLAFYVDDLDAVIAQVEAHDWWFRGNRPEAKSRYIFVKDPDGYEIEILQAK